MAISWDEYQLPALSSWVTSKLPLVHGEITIATMDIPPNCFSGTVSLPKREFTVFVSLDSPLSDVTVNVFLGYIVALAYDRSEWEKMPSLEMLVDCHRQVCETMLDLNEDFSQTLEDYAQVLDVWYETHAEANGPTTEVDTDDLVSFMGSSLFAVNPDDSKDYGSN